MEHINNNNNNIIIIMRYSIVSKLTAAAVDCENIIILINAFHFLQFYFKNDFHMRRMNEQY